jgi:hypothetical protein
VAQYQVLYWHDIPLQVRAGQRRNRYSEPLSKRFQEAVDNASMRAGVTSDDAYLSGLRWSDPVERDGTPEAVVREVIAELETQFAQIDWRATVANISQVGGNVSTDEGDISS